MRDKRRYGCENMVKVDALDCDELGADEIPLLGIDNEDAIVELVEPEREGVERASVLAERVDRGVAVSNSEQCDCSHELDRHNAGSLRVECIHPRGFEQQCVASYVPKWFGMPSLDRRCEDGRVAVRF